VGNDVVVWDSLAILEYLADKAGRDRFWPKDDAARGHRAGDGRRNALLVQALRQACPMNIRRRVELPEMPDAVRHDIIRILQLWAEARARFGQGGPFLFGTFGAADIFYAPVVSRFLTYGIGVPGFAQAYMEAVWDHEWMQSWIAAAESEEWVLEQYEKVPTR
jgi:glutathione S-transferase